jgi:hypothetical protein
MRRWRSKFFRRAISRCHTKPPREITLDLHETDEPLRGHQEGRFSHDYYDCYCYLPLYIVSKGMEGRSPALPITTNWRAAIEDRH